MVNWEEWVGMLALLMLAAMSGMVGWYLKMTAKNVGIRPEDRVDGEIHENAGDIGLFAPWSWWPLVLASAAGISFLGLAVGWWVFYIGAGLAIIGVVGWVNEFSRGKHAH